MKYLDEYRDGALAAEYAEAIRRVVTRPWVLMEICGGQTHSIVKHGIDSLLPSEIELVHGPGCPVCVTPMWRIDQALELARAGVVICSFGDMLRVPGSQGDLLRAKAEGSDVRTVYSPLDAVGMARDEPDKEFTFFAVGFETTAPAHALAVLEAQRLGLHNFSLLNAHVRVPPSMEAILSSPSNRVQGFLAAGHVCSVMGTAEYEPLAARFKVPIVVTGFEPVDILLGVFMCVQQLEEGRHEVENPYARAVRSEGNLPAQQAMRTVFEVTDQSWRGLGTIASSGLRLRDELAGFDAEARYRLVAAREDPASGCEAAKVLQGRLKPVDCPLFGRACTPESPAGAPMVSSEGACAAYYRYRSHEAVPA